MFAALTIRVIPDTTKNMKYQNEYKIDVEALRKDSASLRVATKAEVFATMSQVSLEVVIAATRKYSDFLRWSNAYIPAILLRSAISCSLIYSAPFGK